MTARQMSNAAIEQNGERPLTLKGSHNIAQGQRVRPFARAPPWVTRPPIDPTLKGLHKTCVVEPRQGSGGTEHQFPSWSASEPSIFLPPIFLPPGPWP